MDRPIGEMALEVGVLVDSVFVVIVLILVVQ
jgi:hypothetical protein